MIVSVSGIRGILNRDLSLADVTRFAENFAGIGGSKEVLVGRDTRLTGPAIWRAVAAGLLASGVTVLDCGVVSTPALFRQSRVTGLPAVMVTASHNEPEFNGLKFLVEGAGMGKEGFDRVVGERVKGRSQFLGGTVKQSARPTYVSDLVERFGEGSCEGARVAVDLGGGAAISQAPLLLKRLGCRVYSANDTPGVFSRKVDPVADELDLLKRMVKERDCDVGLAFDGDGDRLVIVDSGGKKRSGDYMLTLALSEVFRERKVKAAVVSLDTTQAVDEVAKKAGAQMFRSKVGEANVVGKMKEVGAEVGGEGSSGGLIDGTFNYCRDSMVAALLIARAIRREGRGFYRSVPSYHLARVALAIPRRKAERGIKALAAHEEDADRTDGLKLKVTAKSWVLIRPSGTEDAVRVSAEAETAAKASDLAHKFAGKLRELSR